MGKRVPVIDVATDFFKDAKTQVVATILDLDVELVQLRIIKLWASCRDEGLKCETASNEEPGWLAKDSLVNGLLGHKGAAEALIEAELATRWHDGRIYLRGSGRTVKNLRAARARGGNHAKSAEGEGSVNDRADGRPTVVQRPLDAQDGRPTVVQRPSNGPATTTVPRTPSYSGSPPERAHAIPPSPPPPGLVALDQRAAELECIGNAGFDRLNAIRAEVAKHFGWTDLRALHPFDVSRRDLRERLRESSDPAGDLEHVLAVAKADAIDNQTAEYLGGQIFTAPSWGKKLAMRVADAGRQRRENAPTRERREVAQRPMGRINIPGKIANGKAVS